MATWNKVVVKTDDGRDVDALCPIIVSASRSTDIPAFYADWFFYRLMKCNYSAWTNPFNSKKCYVSYGKTRFIVFWSKNPKNLIGHLPELKERNINFYLQYSVNDYQKEKLESGLPSLGERIGTFRRIVDLYDANHVVWRFDPLILSDSLTVDVLLERVKYIGDRLKGYTNKLVFSFADILSYRRVQNNLNSIGFRYRDWKKEDMQEFARGLAELNRSWNFELATCGEEINLPEFGIRKNRCVDDRLIVKIAHTDIELMKFLHVRIIDNSSSVENNSSSENFSRGGQESMDFDVQDALQKSEQPVPQDDCFDSFDSSGQGELFALQGSCVQEKLSDTVEQGELFGSTDREQFSLFLSPEGSSEDKKTPSVLADRGGDLSGCSDDVIDLGGGKIAVFDRDNRDRGQREFCGCIISKDIGEYSTCVHRCQYCYANTSIEAARGNLENHKRNPYSETITGK